MQDDTLITDAVLFSDASPPEPGVYKPLSLFVSGAKLYFAPTATTVELITSV